jgi:outer membrane protein assembly factor BamA
MTEDSDGVELKFEVSAGDRAKLGRVRVQDELGGELEVELPRADYFSQELLEDQLGSIIKAYADSGFPFAAVEPAHFMVVEQSLSYDLILTPGIQVELSRVEFNIGPRTLAQVMGVEPGTIYCQRRIDLGLKKIEALGGFKVKGYEIVDAGGEWVLKITLLPTSRRTILGGLGVHPAAGEYWGDLKLNLEQILGSLRSIAVDYRGGKGRTELELHYEEPYPWGWNLKLGFDLSHSARDTSYSRTFGLGALSLPLSEWSLRFGLGWESVIAERYGERYWFGTGIERDIRDYPLNPRQGWFLGLDSRVGKFKADRWLRSMLDGGGAIKTYKEIFTSVEIHLRSLTGPAFPDPYQGFKLGGASSLRGYPEEAISANLLGWANIELRWISGQDGRWFLFTDLAGYEARSYAAAQSFGAGVRVAVAPGVPLELAYGVAWGSSIQDGLIHIRLGWEF